MRKIILLIVVVLFGGFIYGDALAAGPKKINKCTTITKSGSYVVNKNLQATTKTAGNCIVIDADFVTLDLNGFTLTGLEDGTGSGVWGNNTFHQGIVVRNGMITGFSDGINFFLGRDFTIEKIRAFGNNRWGMRIPDRSTVTGNTVAVNGSEGIIVFQEGTVTGNIAIDNGGHGISVSNSSTVSGNTASDNGGDGIHVRSKSSVTGNTAYSNGSDGLWIGCPSNIIGNTAVNNIDQNMKLDAAGCLVSDNLAP